MDYTASLSDRAKLAATRAHAADPDLSRLTPDTVEWRIRAEHARHVSAALGVDPAAVTVADDPTRRYGTYPAYLITIYDDATRPAADGTGYLIRTGRPLYRLIPEPGIHGSYLLLLPCPQCNQPVPGPAIASLVDLGRAIHGDPALSTTHARWDRGHDSDCPLFQPTG
jgi:hypothetical protein